MIYFKTLKWRNFLSTGNNFTEVRLDQHKTSLIVGENGAGKSTILDALTFALFGKPFRNINKPAIVNSVNKKGAEVQIEFTTNGKDYKIVRGIKPNIFEIYCEGTIINQDSASRDYQKHLESFVLKMNYKSFTQIVILGSASFTPFMQLSAADRRAVIEDLLDIEVFSVMNNIVRDKIQSNKSDLETNRIELSSKEDNKFFIEKYIDNIKQSNQDKIQQHKNNIQNYEKKIDITKTNIALLEKKRLDLLDGISSNNTLKEKHKKLIGLQSKIEGNLKRQQKFVEFYENNTECPTCQQNIEHNFRLTAINQIQSKITELETGLDDITKEIDKCIEQIGIIEKLLSECNDITNEITSYNTHILLIESSINDLELEIERISNSDSMLIQNQKDLEVVMSELDILKSDKEKLLSDKMLLDTAITLLKDGGIKTKIIRQYLPVINKLINKYLSQMSFFVNFNINEQFEETIKSRYRDDFSYENFSEGEKQKIDLALMFTWRQVSKLRNSCATNLLIFDEIFDSSLDQNGIDNLMNLLYSQDNDKANIFLISHRNDAFFDKFEKTYRFVKKGNFSYLE